MDVDQSSRSWNTTLELALEYPSKVHVWMTWCPVRCYWRRQNLYKVGLPGDDRQQPFHVLSFTSWPEVGSSARYCTSTLRCHLATGTKQWSQPITDWTSKTVSQNNVPLVISLLSQVFVIWQRVNNPLSIVSRPEEKHKAYVIKATFLSHFRFTAKLGGRYRNFPNILHITHIELFYHYFPQSGTFITNDESTDTIMPSA